jgi:hypothetical protein
MHPRRTQARVYSRPTRPVGTFGPHLAPYRWTIVPMAVARLQNIRQPNPFTQRDRRRLIAALFRAVALWEQLASALGSRHWRDMIPSS